jgi:hypothetical protein
MEIGATVTRLDARHRGNASVPSLIGAKYPCGTGSAGRQARESAPTPG